LNKEIEDLKLKKKVKEQERTPADNRKVVIQEAKSGQFQETSSK
jgi:hypothetical protein